MNACSGHPNGGGKNIRWLTCPPITLKSNGSMSLSMLGSSHFLKEPLRFVLTILFKNCPRSWNFIYLYCDRPTRYGFRFPPNNYKSIFR